MATPTGASVLADDWEGSAGREWRGSDGSCRITFSKKALEQLRFESSRAMNGPGGLGVGGVLLGTRLGIFFRIMRYQPIACGHTVGPDFRLSYREANCLSLLLEELRSGPESHSSQVVGWFVSHPRGGLQMTSGERDLHERLFASGHVALVAKPDRLGSLDLAVYHAPEGSEVCGSLVEPVLSVFPDASFRPVRKSALARRQELERSISMPKSTEVASQEIVVVPAVNAAIDAAAVPAVAAPSRTNLFVLALLVILLGSAFGVYYWNRHLWEVAATPPVVVTAPIQLLSLHVYEKSGQFFISWDGKAEALRHAARVVLVIEDGYQKARYELSKTEATTGLRPYRRVTTDVTVNLEVHGQKGLVVEESTHYAARLLAPPAVLWAAPKTTPVAAFTPAAVPLQPEK